MCFTIFRDSFRLSHPIFSWASFNAGWLAVSLASPRPPMIPILTSFCISTQFAIIVLLLLFPCLWCSKLYLATGNDRLYFTTAPDGWYRRFYYNCSITQRLWTVNTWHDQKIIHHKNRKLLDTNHNWTNHNAHSVFIRNQKNKNVYTYTYTTL